MRTKIVIIGGGIGGLTAAIALARGGHKVAVFEQAPAIKPVGKGIWVPPNAMSVFEKLGLDGAILRAGWFLENVQLRDTAAGLLRDIDVRALAARHGHPIVSIHRSSLLNILVEALPPGALHLGKRCTGFQTHDGRGVSARFSDGSTASGDLLVGSDGLRSTIRGQLFPSVALRYSGQTCYLGVALQEPAPGMPRTSHEIWGGKLRIGYSALGPRHRYWFAPQLSPPDQAPPDHPLPDWLADRYAAFPPMVAEMLRKTPQDDIIKVDLHDFVPLKTWSTGRVVLLGDAAHAMTPNLGQGGAKAVEDGYTLAEKLCAHDQPEHAIAAYERARVKKVARIVELSRTHGRLAHLRNPLARTLRNALMKHLPAALLRKQMDRLYSS